MKVDGIIKRNKKCIKCGVQIHFTDWIILKEMSSLPICDNCTLEVDVKESELTKKNENISLTCKIIKLPIK